MRESDFRDQVAVITGASAGIGRALAIKLAGQGAKVVIAARRIERLESVAAECRALGAEVLVVPTDVTDEMQCKTLIEKTIAAFGRLDLLVNNAGLTVTSLFDEFRDLDLFRYNVNVNFYGAVYCTYYALPYLKQTKGRIAVISSAGGIAAIPGNSSYCSSKYALHGFFESLRMELSTSGVSVTMICPWWVRTEFHEAMLNKDGVPRGISGRAIYTKRTMSAERCAEVALQAAYHRRRQVLMGLAPLAACLKVLAPGFLDWFIIKIFMKDIVSRIQSKSL
jgi:short-subunit dehydrogenase